jgi:hypothetical protein
MFSQVERDHVVLAAQLIDAEGVPPRRQARNHNVRVNGKEYPPKYLMSKACYFATGSEPGVWDTHSLDAIARLEELGFTVS